jgi:hypothetical protein
MIFILGSFVVGVSLIKLFLTKNNKIVCNNNNIDTLINEYEIIELSTSDNYESNDTNNTNNSNENIIPIITIEHLNKIDENIEKKIKDLGFSIKKNNEENTGITPEERIFHTIMKKGNLYADEYKRTIDNIVVIEFLKLARELNINLNESINDESFDQIYIKYVDELIRKKLD